MAGCFDKLRAAKSNPINDEILSIYDKHLEDGVSPEDAELKTVLDYHKQLFDDVNTLRTHVNLKPVDYQAYDPTAINAKYDSLAKQQADTVNTPSPDKAAVPLESAGNEVSGEQPNLTYKKGDSLPDHFVYHNTRADALKDIEANGLTAGAFSDKPIKFSGDKYIAVDKSDLPDVQSHQYGDTISHETNFVTGYDKNGFPIESSLSPDKIYEVNSKGKVLRRLGTDSTSSAESHAQAIDSGDVTVAPQDILKTAGELVDKHLEEIGKVAKNIEDAPDYGVYAKRFPDGTTWYGVKDPKGTSDGKGNQLLATPEDAQRQADRLQKEATYQKETAARKETERQIKESQQEAQTKFLQSFAPDASPMQRGKLLKSLDKKWTHEGKIQTSKQIVDKAFADGNLELNTYEEDRIKGMHRRQFNRATQREQDIDAQRIKDGGKVTKYTVNGLDLGKTAYDYAQHLKESSNESSTQSPNVNDRQTTEVSGESGSPSDQGNEPGEPKTANPSESAPAAERQTANENVAAGESGKERGGESGGVEKQRVEPVQAKVEANGEKIDTIAGSHSYLDFEKKEYEPYEVTRQNWVDLQRSERRRIGQSEDSGTKAAPNADYEEYHRQSVEDALKKGKEVDDRVLADYPDLKKQASEAKSTPAPKADLRVGDRVQDTFGRKGRVYAEKSGELKIEQDGTKARLPLSDKWSLIGKRPLEVNGFKKGDIVAKKDQVGKVYEYGGQLRVKWNKDGKVRSEPLSEKWTKTANSQAGSVDPSLLTLGMDKTVKEDIAPAVRRAGQSVKNAFDDVRKLIFAGNRGESAKLAASSLRAELGKKARSALVAETALKEARGVFAKSPIEDNYDFISHVEGGNLQNLPPAYQPIARELRRLLDESRQRVQDLGTGKLENYIENYFPHIWEDPNKAANVFAKTVAKRPFEGSKAFLKQRTYNTFEEGLDAGLKPVSDNPVDLTLLKIRDMDKYVAAHNTINYLKEKGAAGVVKTGQKPPDGATKIDDKISEVRYINDKGELVTSGHLYADEPAATVINNFLSPGLTGSKFAAVRDAYKTWKYVGNLMNQAQLGLSAFHAAFTTIDAATSKMAAGINQLAQGKPVTALRSFAEVPVSPITNLIRGDKIYREGLTPGSTDAYSQAMADLVTEAGGRFKMDDFYHTKAAQKMMDAFKRGNLLGGLVRTPSAALDIASRPLMEWLVPRQKLGVFADLAKNTVDRLGPDATKDQLREALGKDWDTVDNRMGQLVYDNLFWNKTVKDLAMASVRSVGWNLGDIRELGGAVKDTITLPRRVQQSYKGENMPVPVVTQRMAYAMALPLMSGMIGAVTQYLFTGQGPQELKDYFFPKTGNTDENGNPERLNLPTYMKDVYAYADHPLKTLANKAHPLIGLTSQMLSNKDYYGTEIRNSDDPFVQQLTDLAKHVGKSFLPFSLQGAMKEKERQGSPTTKALSFFGFNPAPKNIDTTKAQDLAYEIYAQSKGDEPKTKEAAARNKEIGDLVRLRKLGKDDDFQTEYQKAVKAGVISPADMKSINQRMKGSFFQYAVGRMTIDDAVKVYEIATPEEKTLLQKQMTTKINNAQTKGHITPQVAKKLADLGLKDIPAKTSSDDEDQ